MFRRLSFFPLCVLLLTPGATSAAVSSLLRSLDRTVALTNSHAIVSASFTNHEAATVRGFYYSDQLPSDLAVTPVSVQLNGQNLTNYSFETGLEGDVIAGCTPYRWIVERPGALTETNPVPPQATVQIVYAVSATNSGTFPLQPAAWIGYDRSTTNAMFGFTPVTAPISVSFISTFASPTLSLALTNGQVRLTFPAEVNVTYLVEYTADLNAMNWLPLTNVVGTGTTMQVEDVVTPGANRLYRLRLP
jgi:hypothetical protein